ncbi:RNA polymerase sigma factor [Pseudonocardia tropica]|uniref:RNA polymerase sigma factor n=1 Tax=Pseudonocardia tropica TaxID=681289 RepID=A0ABV1K1Z7_9PSEU
MAGDQGCCGRASPEQCRCYTDAGAVAAAVGAFVRARVRHRQDAEDITQDALLRLYRAAPGLHDELALDAWMYRIARTAIIDHHRRTAVRPRLVDGTVDGTADGRDLPADEPEEPPAQESFASCQPRDPTELGRSVAQATPRWPGRGQRGRNAPSSPDCAAGSRSWSSRKRSCEKPRSSSPGRQTGDPRAGLRVHRRGEDHLPRPSPVPGPAVSTSAFYDWIGRGRPVISEIDLDDAHAANELHDA